MNWKSFKETPTKEDTYLCFGNKFTPINDEEGVYYLADYVFDHNFKPPGKWVEQVPDYHDMVLKLWCELPGFPLKKEMKMMPNGNYEEIISPIQHECIDSKTAILHCVEYGWDLGNLYLTIEDGDPYEDGYSKKFLVNYCPFCSYQPERSKREDARKSDAVL